ncbi:MAG: LytTR family DNA-binding domain-containing protein [Lachnospiraceae bacterium]|nr:LytTR family DNA-binding domain-containing protein [Lachnospiraceae bacterium]MDD3616802.1 LytTR family DNA-binding domain-containing protein [Lachnospiraceae bacterium]
MKKIAICDDEWKVCIKLQEQLEATVSEEHEIIKTQSIKELEEYIYKDGGIDILFLDIQLHEENGIDAAVKLQRYVPQMAIIFITGYIDYAKDIFKVIPTYFLLKPFTDEEIREALSRAEQVQLAQRAYSVTIMEDKKIIQLYSQNIHYAESKNRTIEIITSTDRYTTYMKLDDLEQKLPDNFLRPHKSYLVNMNAVSYFSAKEMILYDGTVIPVSKRRYQKTKEAYLAYFA